jgi:YbbR domain-containing protein
MAMRELVLNNFKWKVTAVVLAAFVWFVVQAAIQRGANPTDHPLSEVQNTTYRDIPVLVLKSPDDPRIFALDPPVAKVTIRHKVGNLKNTVERSIKVFINLTDVEEDKDIAEALTYAPEGIDIVRVEPQVVGVKRVTDRK